MVPKMNNELKSQFESVFAAITDNFEVWGKDELEFGSHDDVTIFSQCIRSQECYVFRDYDDDDDNGKFNKSRVITACKKAMKNHNVQGLVSVTDLEKWWFEIEIRVQTENDQ